MGLQVHAAVYDVFSVVLHGVLIFLVCFVILSSGVQQRKFYLSIFALCGGSLILVKAEVILGIDGCTNDALSVILGDLFYSSIFALCGGSFIFVKAEVTLEIDGCTDEALSVVLGGLSCVFTCQSNVVNFNSLIKSVVERHSSTKFQPLKLSVFLSVYICVH